jgi:hypothetical protein
MKATIKLGLSSVLLMVAGGLAAYAPAAFAQTSQIKNVGIPGRCLAVRLTDNAARNENCTGAANQLWTQVAVSGGVVLQNVGTGLCLLSTQQPSTGALIAVPCSFATTQQWQRIGTGTVRFRAVSGGRYLNAIVSGSVSTSVSGTVGTSGWQY